MGSWARAAHPYESYRDFGGLKAPAQRRMWPRFCGDASVRVLLLVAIDIHDIRLCSEATQPGRQSGAKRLDWRQLCSALYVPQADPARRS